MTSKLEERNDHIGKAAWVNLGRLTPGTGDPDLLENPHVLKQKQLRYCFWVPSGQRKGSHKQVLLEEQQRGSGHPSAGQFSYSGLEKEG